MANKLITDNVEAAVSVAAIVTTEPLYRLCWLINQQLGWHLAESEKLNVLNPEFKQMQGFYVFAWSDESSEIRYYIIQNKGAQGPLDSSLKYADYWLRIEGNADIADVCSKIKNISEIQIIQPITKKQLAKNSLVFKNPLYDNVE